jgi:hypothetical protein
MHSIFEARCIVFHGDVASVLAGRRTMPLPCNIAEFYETDSYSGLCGRINRPQRQAKGQH